MMTVIVGRKVDGGTCRMVTLADGVDEPRIAEFPLPTQEAPLIPGKPQWANYVKGVVQHYKGRFLEEFDF